MKWKTKVRCFFTFTIPLSFYRRNYDGWKEIPADSLAKLEDNGEYLLFSVFKEEEDHSTEERQLESALEVEDHKSSEKMAQQQETPPCSSNEENLNFPIEPQTGILLEKSFLKRNGLTLLRLFFQSFGLSFAISFGLSMPALLQLIPLDLRLTITVLLKPLSFVLDPLVRFYDILRDISRYIQGYDPTWLYVIAEEWFRVIANTIPFLPKLPETKISWQWVNPPNDPDRPQIAPQHQRILGKLYQLIPNQWINLFFLWMLTAIPMFFFLSYRLGRQVIELMPEKRYLKRVQVLGKVVEDCKGVTIVGVKKNRLIDKTSKQWQLFRVIKFLSRYGMVFSFILPVLLGSLFAFI